MTAAINAISAVASAAAQSLSKGPAAVAPAPTSFSDALKATMTNSVSALQTSEAASLGAAYGQTSVQEVVQTTINAELAVETAISVRNKLIESYQDILRMPI